MKSSKRSHRRRSESPSKDDDDDEGDDVGRDIADVLTEFCEERLEIWRGDSNDTAQSRSADNVSRTGVVIF